MISLESKCILQGKKEYVLLEEAVLVALTVFYCYKQSLWGTKAILSAPTSIHTLLGFLLETTKSQESSLFISEQSWDKALNSKADLKASCRTQSGCDSTLQQTAHCAKQASHLNSQTHEHSHRPTPSGSCLSLSFTFWPQLNPSTWYPASPCASHPLLYHSTIHCKSILPSSDDFSSPPLLAAGPKAGIISCWALQHLLLLASTAPRRCCMSTWVRVCRPSAQTFLCPIPGPVKVEILVIA